MLSFPTLRHAISYLRVARGFELVNVYDHNRLTSPDCHVCELRRGLISAMVDLRDGVYVVSTFDCSLFSACGRA